MKTRISSMPRLLLGLLILTLIQGTAFSRQVHSSDLNYLDSLTTAGLYQDALDGFKANIARFEAEDNTISMEYMHSVRQAIYCQVRLPDFAKAKGLVQKILPLIDQYQHLDPLELASLYLIIGEYDYLISGDFDRALVYMRRGYIILKDAESRSDLVARAATYMGALFTNRSEYDSSLSYLNQARKLYIEQFGKDHFLVAGVYSQMGQNHLQAGQYWKSLSSIKQMLTISTNEIDSTLIDESRYLEADSLNRFYDDFINLSAEKKIPHQFHPIDAEVGRVITMAYFKLGDLKMAHRLVVLFQEVYEQNNSPYLVADCQNILGNIYVSQYQFEYALSLYRQSKNTYASLGLADAHTAIWVYENLASAHSKLDNLDSAAYYDRKALAIKKKSFKSDNSQIARSYYRLSSFFSFQTDSDSVLHYLNKAIKSGYIDEGHVWYEKGRTFLEIDNLDSAHSCFSIALAQLKGRKSEFNLATLNGLGDIFLKRGYLDSAYNYYHRALIVGYPDIEKVIDGSGELEIDKIDHLSRFLSSLSKTITYQLNKYEQQKDVSLLIKAKTLGRISERLISQVRGSFIMESDHLRFSATIASVIEHSIEVNIQLFEQSGDKEFLKEAFRIADLNKSQILLEALRSTIKEVKYDNTLINKWSQLRNNLRFQRVKLQERTISETSSVTDIAQDRRYLAQLEDEYAELLKYIKETQPRLFFYVSDNSSDFSVNSFQRHLKRSNSIAIQYFQSKDYLYQFWLSEDDITYTKSNFGADTLDKAATEFHEFISRPPTGSSEYYAGYLSNAHALYSTLLPLLDRQRPDKSLIIIPDGVLSSIPFEALLTKPVDSQEADFSELPYLIKQRPVSYAFSASVLSETLRNSKRPDNLIATGWAPFSDELKLDEPQKNTLRGKNLAKLVGATLEIQGIREQFDGENFISKRASESTFRKKARDSRIIHIATHGIVMEESPELSYLVFNKDEQDSLNDGDLHLFELYDIPLQADLTILSACNTGTGKLALGEGVMSMARAFTYSGSKSVMMSLWLANDKSTYQLIDGFYQNLAGYDGKSSALQKSKLGYLAQADNLMSHPFYWAHIISTGNDAPLIKRQFNPLWLLLVIPILAMILKYRRSKQRLTTPDSTVQNKRSS
ncbi:MAG: CHAT domain-containing protein [Roseivirga sp.]|nr:CHAT domain-containing protein [Roseivirga sp.]